MSKRSPAISILVPIGAALGLAASGIITFEGGKEQYLWIPVGCATAALVAVSAWGMWRRQFWALWISSALAIGALSIGLLGAHFAWSFWFLEKPSLMDRILAVLLNLRAMLFLICPVIWLGYFFRPNIRSQFTRTQREGTA